MGTKRALSVPRRRAEAVRPCPGDPPRGPEPRPGTGLIEPGKKSTREVSPFEDTVLSMQILTRRKNHTVPQLKALFFPV